MKKKLRLYLYIGILGILCSCSVQKFIPEGEYLLDEVNIVSDTKVVHPDLFYTYIRQNPNGKWFNLLRVPVGIYCLSGQDSTKAINRFWRKLGDEPVIYDPMVAMKSRKEIEKAVRNMGYMRAEVSLDTIVHNRKLKLSYNIKAGRPYVVRHIAYNVDDMVIYDHIEKDSVNSYLSPGMVFDVAALDSERQRITKLLQDNGYYKFNKDFLVYQADTVKNTYQVDLTMKLLPYQQKKDDEPTKHKQYTVRNVNYLTGENVSLMGEDYAEYDSLYHKGLHIYSKGTSYLRPNTLAELNYIRPGELYSDQDVQSTLSALGRLRALKYTNLRFDEVMQNDSAYLDAHLMLTKGKNQSMAFEIEGTNSAGDLGAAASLTYHHRNLFRGNLS